MSSGYTPGETAALKGLFDMFDKELSGFVDTSDLEDILEKVGRDPSEGKKTWIEYVLISIL